MQRLCFCLNRILFLASLMGVLNHLGVCKYVNLNTAVLSFACRCRVVGNRLRRAFAD